MCLWKQTAIISIANPNARHIMAPTIAPIIGISKLPLAILIVEILLAKSVGTGEASVVKIVVIMELLLILSSQVTEGLGDVLDMTKQLSEMFRDRVKCCSLLP